VVSAAAATPIIDISESVGTVTWPSSGKTIAILGFLELILKLCSVILTELYNECNIASVMTQLKDLVDGMVVGSGSDFIVIQKGKKRLLVESSNFTIKELKTATTPYGSQTD
jgi:hypothetical protein